MSYRISLVHKLNIDLQASTFLVNCQCQCVNVENRAGFITPFTEMLTLAWWVLLNPMNHFCWFRNLTIDFILKFNYEFFRKAVILATVEFLPGAFLSIFFFFFFGNKLAEKGHWRPFILPGKEGSQDALSGWTISQITTSQPFPAWLLTQPWPSLVGTWNSIRQSKYTPQGKWSPGWQTEMWYFPLNSFIHSNAGAQSGAQPNLPGNTERKENGFSKSDNIFEGKEKNYWDKAS